MTTLQYIGISLLTGLTGTTIMTLFVLAIHRASRYQLNVIRILGTMLTGSTGPNGECAANPAVYVTGTIVHYLVGFFFAFIYVFLWNNEMISRDWITTGVIGFITGLVGIAVWRLYFFVYSQPPAVELRWYLPCILFAHVVFAWGAQWAYQLDL